MQNYLTSSITTLKFVCKHITKTLVPLSILLVLTVVRRAFLKEHSDAGTFVDQHIAAGAFSRRLAQIYENYFGDDK